MLTTDRIGGSALCLLALKEKVRVLAVGGMPAVMEAMARTDKVVSF